MTVSIPVRHSLSIDDAMCVTIQCLARLQLVIIAMIDNVAGILLLLLQTFIQLSYHNNLLVGASVVVFL